MLLECSQNCLSQNTVILKIFGWISKALILAGNVWVSIFVVHGGVFIIINVSIIGAMLTRESLHAFWEGSTRSNNIYKNVVVYRQFQILNTLSNLIQRNCLGLLIVVGIIVMASCIGLLVGFFNGAENDTNIFLVAALVILTVDGILCYLVYLGGLVLVYTDCKRRLEFAKRLEWGCGSNADRRWVKRFWKSCDVLKTRFGEDNYLEELTPLNCIDMVFNLAVQFLLLSRNK